VDENGEPLLTDTGRQKRRRVTLTGRQREHPLSAKNMQKRAREQADMIPGASIKQPMHVLRHYGPIRAILHEYAILLLPASACGAVMLACCSVSDMQPAPLLNVNGALLLADTCVTLAVLVGALWSPLCGTGSGGQGRACLSATIGLTSSSRQCSPTRSSRRATPTSCRARAGATPSHKVPLSQR
jgi:hypothetical protein